MTSAICSVFGSASASRRNFCHLQAFTRPSESRSPCPLNPQMPRTRAVCESSPQSPSLSNPSHFSNPGGEVIDALNLLSLVIWVEGKTANRVASGNGYSRPWLQAAICIWRQQSLHLKHLLTHFQVSLFLQPWLLRGFFPWVLILEMALNHEPSANKSLCFTAELWENQAEEVISWHHKVNFMG